MQVYQRLLFVRFVRVAVLVIAVTGTLLLALRVAWGWEADKRLTASRARLQAAHVPVDLSEFEAHPIPANRNGALVLMDALKLRQVEDGELGPRGGEAGRGFFYGRMFWGLDTRRAKAMLARNRQTLEILRRAAQMPDAQWPDSEIINQPLPETGLPANDDLYVGMYELRWVVRLAAEAEHRQHDETAAIADIETMLGLSRIIGAYPSLAAQTISESMRSDAAQTLERWMPEMTFTGQQAVALRRVTAELLNSSPASDRLSRAFEYETVAYPVNTRQQVPTLSQWWIRPLLTDAFARRLDAQVSLLRTAEARNWQELGKVPVSHPLEHTNLDMIVFTFSQPDVDVVDAMRFHFRAQVDTEAVAILLACSLEHAQNGKYPTSLAQLVPTYFAKAPTDPFAADGQPLHFRLDKDGPSVWSVGEDGKNDDASFAAGTLAPPFSGGTGRGGAAGSPGSAGARRFGRGGMGFRGTPASAWGRGPGGFGGGGMYAFRRYVQPDIVYGAAWRDAVNAAMTSR